RTLHIEDNACFDCHRIGMSTVEMFLLNGWRPERFMPPHRPGSLQGDWEELLTAWREGPEKVEGARWIVPPARGQEERVVGDDYPYKAYFNAPGASFFGTPGVPGEALAKKEAKGHRPMTDAATAAEVERLLAQLEDAGTRKAFEGWIEKNGVTPEVLSKLRSMAGGKKGKD
ncbi:MAG: hypothetical protein AAGB93_19990, partial [Planctomycetota bacterium]